MWLDKSRRFSCLVASVSAERSWSEVKDSIKSRNHAESLSPCCQFYCTCWERFTYFFLFKVVIVTLQFVKSAPQQFFGQSFSSSSVLTPNGEVIGNSIYVDSNGNRVVNGEHLKMKPEPQSHQASPSVATRPDWQTDLSKKPQDNSGQYVHDNSGQYNPKGKWRKEV